MDIDVAASKFAKQPGYFSGTGCKNMSKSQKTSSVAEATKLALNIPECIAFSRNADDGNTHFWSSKGESNADAVSPAWEWWDRLLYEMPEVAPAWAAKAKAKAKAAVVPAAPAGPAAAAPAAAAPAAAAPAPAGPAAPAAADAPVAAESKSKKDGSEDDNLRAELIGLTLKALKERARIEGVEEEVIEEFDEAEHPKTAAIEFIISQVNKNLSWRACLQEELRGMSLKSLKEHARELNISSEMIEAVDEDDDPKMAAIDLILVHRKAKPATKVVKGMSVMPHTVTKGYTRIRPVKEASVCLLPHTKWMDIQPTRTFLEELGQNDGIRKAVPDIDIVIMDIQDKMKELRYIDEAVMVMKDMDENDVASVLAYTHDLGKPDGEAEGNFFFELNNALRLRDSKGRSAMMKTWGVCVHFILKGLGKMPDEEGLLFRGLPSRSDVEKEYKAGRPIQWGAFVSTSCSIEVAKEFCDMKNGVLVKIKGGIGKKLGAISFFQAEEEVLLSPNARFIVAEEVAQEGDWSVLELIQEKGERYVF